MKRYSLTRRIVLAVISVELLCAGGVSAVSLLHEYRSRLHAFDETLQGRSDSLLGAIQDAEDPGDNVIVDPSELKLPPDDLYTVYNRGGAALGGANAGSSKLTSRRGDGIRYAKANGRSYRVLEREALRVIDRAESHGVGLKRPVTIVYAAPTTNIWHEVFEAAGLDVLVSVAIVLGTTILLLVFLRRLLQPINDVAVSARGVSAQLAFQPPTSALQAAELRPLVDALSSAISRLREALQVQQRFVGDAAHELKTAVAVVRSSIQVLGLKPRSAPEYRDGLEQLLRDNERVEDLVARMLQLARSEEGSHEQLTPANLSSAVEQTVAGLRSFAGARGVELEPACEEEVWAQLSPESAQTVLSNLVVNAVQHSREGSRVEVRAGKHSAPAPKAFLEVRDFGEGIAPESLPHVFERFYRPDSSRSRNTGGAGLGLAICKSLVEGVGGSISIESMEGSGTTVRVTLRLV